MNIELEVSFERTNTIETEILDFEYKHNITLPEDYKRFLAVYNGGKPVIRRFETIDEKHTSSLMLLYPVTKNFEPNLISTFKELNREQILPSNLLAIGIDPIDNLICISTSGSDFGYVYYWSLDMEELDKEGFQPTYKYMSLIARNFTEFIKNLFSPED